MSPVLLRLLYFFKMKSFLAAASVLAGSALAQNVSVVNSTTARITSENITYADWQNTTVRIDNGTRGPELEEYH